MKLAHFLENENKHKTESDSFQLTINIKASHLSNKRNQGYLG